MKSLVLLLAAVSVAMTAENSYFDLVAEEWNAFKLEYNKSYETEAEERSRMLTFARNKYYVAQHNQRYERGEETFRVGLNQFSDMTHSEFMRTMTGFNSTADDALQYRGGTFITPVNVAIPEHMDWRTAGAVTSVKNQGECESCWAFSSTGALEGQYFRKTGSLVSLSEQNLIDCCSKEYGNSGCNGGSMKNAFVYISDTNGIDTETNYPYEAEVKICRYNPKKSGGYDVGYATIKKNDEKKLKEAVATVGPVSVSVDATPYSFKHYTSGVYYDRKCFSRKTNHGMLVVGYGTDATEGDYWLLKNSWGTSWGENGYMKLARNRNNHCGIARRASYPLV